MVLVLYIVFSLFSVVLYTPMGVLRVLVVVLFFMQKSCQLGTDNSFIIEGFFI